MLLQKYAAFYDLKIITLNKYTISFLFCFNDTHPNAPGSFIVYKYCFALCNASYVGSTSRTLHSKFGQHCGRSSVFLFLLWRFSHASAYTVLCIQATFDNFTILFSFPNISHLKFLEFIYIFKYRPSFNGYHFSPLLIILN